MKTITRLVMLLGLAAVFLLRLPDTGLWLEARADQTTRKTFEFTNGLWFDGQKFQPRTFYSVGGILTSKKPVKIDEVVDFSAAGGAEDPRQRR
jgi:hypothetical protein